MGKKAQVAIFMIVGILILVIFAIILFISNNTVTTQFETAAAPAMETVPQEFVAIQEYTTNCLYQTAKQGITILGQQGGYISPNTLGDFSASEPTESVGVLLGPISVPYWHYNANPSSDLAVAIASNKPALGGDEYYSIESQLERYIDEEIGTCLNKYEPFTNQDFIVNSGERNSRVRTTSGFVDVVLDMPLVAQRNSATTEMEVFHTTLDVDIEHIYIIADQITQTEFNSTFLEKHMLNVLEVHTQDDFMAFPPEMSITVNDINSLFWLTDDLERKFKQLLLSYIPSLRYQDSANYYRYEYPLTSDLSDLYQKITDDMVLPLFGAQDLLITFDYLPSWNIYFDINGGEKEIRPNDYSVQSPFEAISFDFNYQKTYTTYDFSFPVLVTIEDPSAFKGTGYTFTYALESNVINNRPFDPEYVQLPLQIDDEKPFICDPSQRNSQDVTTLVIDYDTQEPLANVQIGVEIPQTDFCSMGETQDNGELVTQYPLLYGGLLEFSKDGYLTEMYPLDTYGYKNSPGIVGYAVAGLSSPVIELYPLKKISVGVQKRNINKCLTPRHCNLDTDDCWELLDQVCFFNGGTSLFGGNPIHEELYNGSLSGWGQFYLSGKTPLIDSEEVLLTLERISDVGDSIVQSSSFSQFITINSENPNSLIELVPGKYRVRANVMYNDDLLIPLDKRCYTDDEDDCQNITDTSMSNFMSGSYTWDTGELYFEVLPQDLYSSDSLEFTVIVQNWADVPNVFIVTHENKDIFVNGKNLEDLKMISLITNISSQPQYRSQLEPVWGTTVDEVVVS